MVTEEHHWLRGVDERMMFLPYMVQCYFICDFQYESIVWVMGEVISAFQGGVAFRIIDHHGGRSTKMGDQAVGLYPGKYNVDMPVGKDLGKLVSMLNTSAL